MKRLEHGVLQCPTLPSPAKSVPLRQRMGVNDATPSVKHIAFSPTCREPRSSVKVEVAVLGSPPLTVRTVYVDAHP